MSQFKVTPHENRWGVAIFPFGLLIAAFVALAAYDRRSAVAVVCLVIAFFAALGLYASVLRTWNDYMLISPGSTDLRFQVGRHPEDSVDLSSIVEISSKSGKGSRVIVKYRAVDGSLRRFDFDVIRSPGVEAWFRLIKEHKKEIGHVLTKSGHEVQTAVEINPSGD